MAKYGNSSERIEKIRRKKKKKKKKKKSFGLFSNFSGFGLFIQFLLGFSTRFFIHGQIAQECNFYKTIKNQKIYRDFSIFRLLK